MDTTNVPCPRPAEERTLGGERIEAGPGLLFEWGSYWDGLRLLETGDGTVVAVYSSWSPDLCTGFVEVATLDRKAGAASVFAAIEGHSPSAAVGSDGELFLVHSDTTGGLHRIDLRSDEAATDDANRSQSSRCGSPSP